MNYNQYKEVIRWIIIKSQLLLPHAFVGEIINIHIQNWFLISYLIFVSHITHKKYKQLRKAVITIQHHFRTWYPLRVEYLNNIKIQTLEEVCPYIFVFTHLIN